MAIYTGSSLAECAAPAAPLSRYPSLTCRAVEVVRAGDSTLGLTLVLEPNLGEVGRSSFPARGNTSEYLKVSQRPPDDGLLSRRYVSEDN